MNNKLPKNTISLIFFIILIGGIGWIVLARSDTKDPVKKARTFENIETVSYDDYETILKAYVDDEGMVNYKKLKSDRKKLDTFVMSLAKLDRAKFDKWDDKEKVAFWVNAYNGLTLKSIIDNYPIEASFIGKRLYPKNSIRQISGVWDKTTHLVMGEEMTLNHIEHNILRVKFNEPRIHMALVCAAMSCPPLRNGPYTGTKLNDQLDDQTRKFMAHPKKFRIDRDKGDVYMSKIFDWFGEDFEKTYGTDKNLTGHNSTQRAVLSFVSGHLGGKDGEYLIKGDYDIDYLDYDWTLNERQGGQ